MIGAPVSGKASDISASSGRTPVDNVVARWMGQHGISVIKNGVYTHPGDDENVLPVNDADVHDPGPNAQFWAYQGMASADAQQVSQALFDLTEIIAAERRQTRDWMSKIEGGLEKLQDKIGTQDRNKASGVLASNGTSTAASNYTSTAASNSAIESMVQQEFKKHRLWLSDRFNRLGWRVIQEMQEEGDLKTGEKPEAKPEAKPDSQASSKRDSKQIIPEVLTRAINVHHTSKARQPDTVVETPSTSRLVPMQSYSNPTSSFRKGSRADVHGKVIGSRDLSSERRRTSQYLEKMRKAHHDRSLMEILLRLFGVDRSSIKHFKRKPHNCMTKIVETSIFHTITLLLVISNGVWMGWQTSEQMKDVLEGYGHVKFSKRVSLFYTIAYSIELVMRLLAYRAYFFFGEDFCWNMYDCIVVIAGIADDVLEFADLSMLRTVRVLRMMRVVRLFRIFRLFEGIRYLLCSLVASAWLIFWTLFFLAFVMYLFAVSFMQGFMIAYDEEELDRVEKILAIEYYGTVPRSMLTLFMAFSGGQPWENMLTPVKRASPVLLHCFVYFLIIMLYGILNVVTGVFVEQAKFNRQHDRDLAIQQEMIDSSMFRRQLRAIFKEKRLCDDDEMSEETFQQLLNDIDLQLFLQTHGIDATEAQELFFLLDEEQDGLIPVDDFVFGCLRMKGLAKGIDILLLSEEVSGIRANVTAIVDNQRELYRLMKITKDAISAEVGETALLASDIFEEVRDLKTAERSIEADLSEMIHV